MQMQMRERMMAQQLAMARERLYWWGAFYTLAFVGLTRGYVLDDVIGTCYTPGVVCRAMVRKQPWIMGPLVPLTFVVAYQADLAYGNKMQRVVGQSLSPVYVLCIPDPLCVCVQLKLTPCWLRRGACFLCQELLYQWTSLILSARKAND